MSNLISRKIGVAIMICFSSIVAYGQSYYDDEYCDVGYADCDQIDTELIGDPAPTRGRCGTVEIDSTLNGLYATDSSIYPSTATVKQKVAGATKGVPYSWTFTEYYFPSDGVGGGCSTQRISWTWPLSVSQLNYKLASESGGNCYHNLSCTPPISNACTAEFPTKTTPAPPPDDNGGYCFPYQFYYALIVKKTSGSECLIGVGTDSPVAQPCY